MNCPRCQMANPKGARFCFNCGNQLESQLRVEGERKYVTVLFADVVDSTGLGERLDPEQLAENLHEVQGQVAEAERDLVEAGRPIEELSPPPVRPPGSFQPDADEPQPDGPADR